MFKSFSKLVCAMLAVLLVFASVACMAEVERRTYVDFDAASHRVYSETWEYPVANGNGGSGKTTEDDSETETVVTTEDLVTFTIAALGIDVAAGDSADQVLKQVFAAIPAGTEVKIDGVDAEVADALIKAINEGATLAELKDILSQFPVENVNGTECNVVSISYTDADNKPVSLKLAFSTADAKLVSVY